MGNSVCNIINIGGKTTKYGNRNRPGQISGVQT